MKRKSNKKKPLHKVSKSQKKEYVENKSLVNYLIPFFVLIIMGFALFLNNLKNEKIEVNESDIVMNYFYLETCPHCIKQAQFHKILLEKYPNLKIIKYDLSLKKNIEVYKVFEKKFNLSDEIYTPTSFIGEEFNIGFDSENTTGEKLIQMIENEIKKNEK